MSVKRIFCAAIPTPLLAVGLFRMFVLWSTAAIVAPMFASVGDPGHFPLQPPDTSSPRATLESFMRNTSEGIQAYRQEAQTENILAPFERAERCLDLSEVSRDREASVATEAGLLIYEVLN